MIDNPWYVDNTANYERQRTQDAMTQIRLEHTAMEAARPRAATSVPQPAFLRTLRHATLLMARAVMTILLG